jgi:Predicted ester cyclase
MSVESTRAVIKRFVDSKHTDMGVMADDVMFTVMASGDEHKGPDGVGGMLHYMYHVAFDADAEFTNQVIADGKAVLEGYFVGTHIGEFAGIPATGKSVRVPLCVTYDLENDRIKRGRVYMETPAMFAQLGEQPRG